MTLTAPVCACATGGHAALAALLVDKGDLPAARVSLAHALAYHPSQPQALALAKKLAGRGQRIDAFAIFLEVDGLGVVRVAAAPTAGARMYAGCRAVMRYEPELRSALFAEPASEPYFLSVAEEMFCVESAIGAYLAERAIARERPGPKLQRRDHAEGAEHLESHLIGAGDLARASALLRAAATRAAEALDSTTRQSSCDRCSS